MEEFIHAPVPPELVRDTPTQEALAMRSLSRRRFMIGAGVITGLALAPVELGAAWNALDNAANSIAYPGTESPIATLGFEGTGAPDVPHVASGLNIYPGLGQVPATARKIALKLANVYPDETISYNQYAAQGLQTPNQADEYERWQGMVDEAEIFCNSMGSVTWANVMGEMHTRALAARGATALTAAKTNSHQVKPIKTLTFCSSPFDADDVYQSKAVKLITEHALSGTLTEKFLVKLGTAIGSSKDYSGIKQMIEIAADNTFDQLPPKMWASQIAQLGSSNVGMFASSYAGAVNHDTLVMYLRPKNAADDRVVKVAQAAEKMRDFFTGTFGCKFVSLEMEGASHADIDKACQCAQFEDLLQAKSGLHI